MDLNPAQQLPVWMEFNPGGSLPVSTSDPKCLGKTKAALALDGFPTNEREPRMLVKRQHQDNIRRSHRRTCPVHLVLARLQLARKLSPLINCYVAPRPEWQLANGDNRAPPTSQRTCLSAADVSFCPDQMTGIEAPDYRFSSRC